jgi:hypothetical protein
MGKTGGGMSQPQSASVPVADVIDGDLGGGRSSGEREESLEDAVGAPLRGAVPHMSVTRWRGSSAGAGRPEGARDPWTSGTPRPLRAVFPLARQNVQ